MICSENYVTSLNSNNTNINIKYQYLSITYKIYIQNNHKSTVLAFFACTKSYVTTSRTSRVELASSVEVVILLSDVVTIRGDYMLLQECKERSVFK